MYSLMSDVLQTLYDYDSLEYQTGDKISITNLVILNLTF